MFLDANDPEVRDALRTILSRAAGKGGRPRNPGDFLAGQTLTDVAWSCAVDAAACAGCPGRDGVILTVQEATVGGQPHPSSNRIMALLFEHDDRPSAIHCSAEQAKQLVNRLGEAIAVAERIDREATT